MNKIKSFKKLLIIILSAAMLFTFLPFKPPLVEANPGDKWDLRNFLASVIIKDNTGTTINPGDTVNLGENYLFSFTFEEAPQLQFEYKTGTGFLEYQLPDNILVPVSAENQPIYGAGASKPIIGRYNIATDGLVTIKFYNVQSDGSPTPATETLPEGSINFIDYYTNAVFVLDASAQFKNSGNTVKFIFGDGISINLDIVAPLPSLEVTKDAQIFQALEEKIKYTIMITARNGPVSDIKLSDEILYYLGGYYSIPVTGDIVTEMKYTINNGAPVNIAKLPVFPVKDFAFPGIALNPGDTLKVEYTVDMEEIFRLNPDWNIDPIRHFIYMKNAATVTGNGDIEITREKAVGISRDLMAKTGTYISRDEIQWYFWIGNNITPLGGYTITDTLPDDGLTFNGGIIRFHLYTIENGGRTFISTDEIIVAAGAKSFTYKIPTKEELDGKEVYMVEVQSNYSTHIAAGSEPPAGGYYRNEIKINIGGKDYSYQAGVAPDLSKMMSIHKSSKFIRENEQDYIECTVNYSIEGALLNHKLWLADELLVYDANGTPTGIENDPADITVTARQGDETVLFPYTIIGNGKFGLNKNQWKMYFTDKIYSTESEYANASLSPFAEDTVITISYKIPLSEESLKILRQSPNFNMWANTSFLRNVITVWGINSTGYIIPAQSITYTPYPILKTAKYDKDNQEIQYMIFLNKSQARRIFNPGGPAVFTDEFDSRLEYKPGSFQVMRYAYGYYFFAPRPDETAIADFIVDNGNKSIMTVDLSADYMKEIIGGTAYAPNDPDWYADINNYYVIYYTLKIKNPDEIDLHTATNTANVTIDGEVYFADCEVTYGEPAVKKSMDQINDGNLAKIEIIVNPGAKQLLPETGDGRIEVIDRMSNTLAFYLNSIQIYEKTGSGNNDWTLRAPEAPGGFWSYSVTGDNEITIIIPDNKEVKILYEALIKASLRETAEVSNYVEITGGYRDQVRDVFEVLNTNAAGSGSRTTFTLYKYDVEDTNKFLKNAEFKLYIGCAYDGHPEKKSETEGIDWFDMGNTTFYHIENGKTDENGKIIFKSEWLVWTEYIFALREIKPPAGYFLPAALDDITLFSYAAKDNMEGKTVDLVSDYINIGNTSAKTDAEITGRKTITGIPPNPNDNNEKFVFILTEVIKNRNGEWVTKDNAYTDTTSITGEDTFKFELMNLEAGTYYYRITEQNAGNTIGGWTYSDNVWIVRLTVTDNGDGTVSAGEPVLIAGSDTFVNEYNTVSVSVTKEWIGDHNQISLRLAAAAFQLYQNGNLYGAVKSASQSTDWIAEWNDLPKYMPNNEGEYVYSVKEIAIPGYATEHGDGDGTYIIPHDGNIAITNTMITADYEVQKIWDDGNNSDGARAESITAVLTAYRTNGSTVIDTYTQILSDSNGWYHKWQNLPKYYRDGDNVYEIVYEITESPADLAKVTGIYSSSSSTEGSMTTITNAHTPEFIDVTVTKEWVHNGNANMPVYATVQLYQNGIAYRSAETLSGSLNGWAHTWTNLPKYYWNGAAIETYAYTVLEVTEPATGYISSTNRMAYGNMTDVTFINYYEPSSVQIKAIKRAEGKSLTAGQFEFALEEYNELTNDYMTVETKANGDGGLIEFDTITYSEAGTYVYRISEISIDGSGWTTDGKVYYVKVEARDVSSSFDLIPVIQVKSVEYFRDESMSDKVNFDLSETAEFVNAYMAQPATVKLEISKTLEDYTEDTEQTFEFELWENTEVIDTISISLKNGTESATFKTINYDTAGIYYYTIREVARENWSAAKESYSVTVIVEDNGYGNLIAAAIYDSVNETADFINNYTPPTTEPTTPETTTTANIITTTTTTPTGATTGETTTTGENIITTTTRAIGETTTANVIETTTTTNLAMPTELSTEPAIEPTSTIYTPTEPTIIEPVTVPTTISPATSVITDTTVIEEFFSVTDRRIPLNNGWFAEYDEDEDLWYIFDENGVPLGTVKLPEGETIENYDVAANITPLANITTATETITETTAAPERINPETGDNLINIINIIALLSVSAICGFVLTITGTKKPKK